MNDAENDNANVVKVGGPLADALTLVRLLLTPLIMFVIIKAWSGKPDDPMGFVSLNLSLVLLASILFAIAAVTDILDDFVGGSADVEARQYGWFDDIADSLLIAGTLLALLWVINRAGLLHWSFAIPAALYIGRDVIIALVKGYELSKFGFLETRLGDMKNALAMFATCALVAAPWLSNIVDNIRAGNQAENVEAVYNSASPFVWNAGLIALWIAAILSLYTGYRLLTTKPENGDKTSS